MAGESPDNTQQACSMLNSAQGIPAVPLPALNRQSPVILPPSRASYRSNCCLSSAASSGLRMVTGPVKPCSLYCRHWAGVSTACCCCCCC